MALRLEQLDNPGFREPDDLRVSREMTRLHELPDRFLARAILLCARYAREIHPQGLSRGGASRQARYAATLAWDIAPEIARRLGETALSPFESRADFRRVDNVALRTMTWACYQHSTERLGGDPAGTAPDGGIDPWLLLRHDPAEGNPLYIALDRFAPPGNAYDDTCARYISATWRQKGRGDGVTMWNPCGGRPVTAGPDDADAIRSRAP